MGRVKADAFYFTAGEGICYNPGQPARAIPFLQGDPLVSRLVNTDGVGKQRDRLMKAATRALRELAARKKVDDETRDLVAFIALALHEIHETVDVTCSAWEKRDYWLKADQFRRDWGWASRLSQDLERIVLQDRWQDFPALVPALAQHLEKIKLPKRNALGTPWLGAYAQLRELRGLAKSYKVK
jgi:hypothetical protein